MLVIQVEVQHLLLNIFVAHAVERLLHVQQDEDSPAALRFILIPVVIEMYLSILLLHAMKPY